MVQTLVEEGILTAAVRTPTAKAACIKPSQPGTVSHVSPQPSTVPSPATTKVTFTAEMPFPSSNMPFQVQRLSDSPQGSSVTCYHCVDPNLFYVQLQDRQAEFDRMIEAIKVHVSINARVDIYAVFHVFSPYFVLMLVFQNVILLYMKSRKSHFRTPLPSPNLNALMKIHKNIDKKTWFTSYLWELNTMDKIGQIDSTYHNLCNIYVSIILYSAVFKSCCFLVASHT